jgi:hypothetical protein
VDEGSSAAVGEFVRGAFDPMAASTTINTMSPRQPQPATLKKPLFFLPGAAASGVEKS